MDTELTTVSTTERERALADLKAHFEAGRLHSFEYEDRRGRAGDANDRSELDALFTDLPSLDAGRAERSASGRAFGIEQADAAQSHGRSRCLSHGAAYSWVPLLATALFFVTGSWVWFMMIPAVGYIAGSRPKADSRPANRRVAE